MANKYSGVSASLTLAESISATAVELTVNETSNSYPAQNFIVSITSSGTTEKILVGSRSDGVFSSLTRGYDNTVPVAHSLGSTLKFIIDAKVVDDMSQHMNVGHSQPPGVNVQVFTANGTWTKPAGATLVHVTCIGAGGGGTRMGSSGVPNLYAPGGGGGGAFSTGWIRADLLGATEPVVVGIGGSAGSAGNNGGNGTGSKFSFIFAGGGGGARNDEEGGAGGGGRGGNGATVIPGGPTKNFTFYKNTAAGQGAGLTSDVGNLNLDGGCAENGGGQGAGPRDATGAGLNGGSSICGGGGGGGGARAADTTSSLTGGNGGQTDTYSVISTGAGSGEAGAGGAAGGNGIAGFRLQGGGGGGVSTVAGSGANGGVGGGGGGAGGIASPYSAGASAGAGGRGEVIVVSYF